MATMDANLGCAVRPDGIFSAQLYAGSLTKEQIWSECASVEIRWPHVTHGGRVEVAQLLYTVASEELFIPICESGHFVCSDWRGRAQAHPHTY